MTDDLERARQRQRRRLANAARRLECIKSRKSNPTQKPLACGQKGLAIKANTAQSNSATADQEQSRPASTSQRISRYLSDYEHAQQEIAKQRKKLISLRGGEEHLTKDDRDALDNVADMLAATYDHLLER